MPNFGDLLSGQSVTAIDLGAGSLLSGWYSTDLTFSYSSATSISASIPSASTTFQKGDKIKLYNNNAWKYFYVTDIMIAGGGGFNMYLTLNGGSDFSLVNSAITNVAVSKESGASSFPHWFNYSPSFVGFSVNPTVLSAIFTIHGNTCITIVNLDGATGTSNGTGFRISAPVPAASFSPIERVSARDNNVVLEHAYGWIQPSVDSGTNFILGTNPVSGTGSWTTSGIKNGAIKAVYKI